MWLQQHVAGGGDGARLGTKLQSHHEPHHIRSLGAEAGAQSRGPRPLRSQSQRSSRQRSSRLGTEVWWHGATRKKGTVGEGKGKPCRKMISAVYKHFYDSTILVAECPCLCQFSGDKSYCLPFVCQCLVPWAGWFRFCLPLVMLFCHPFVPPLLVPFGGFGFVCHLLSNKKLWVLKGSDVTNNQILKGIVPVVFLANRWPSRPVLIEAIPWEVKWTARVPSEQFFLCRRSMWGR